MTALVWYRNDLRVAWHTPLSSALQAHQRVRAVYLLCPGQWQQHEVAPLREWYVLHSLQELGESLAGQGITLDVVDCGDFDGVGDALKAYVVEHGISDIYCNREYPLNEKRRDKHAVEALRGLPVTIHGSDDGVLVPPAQLRTSEGKVYTVFTPYRRRWDQWLADNPPARPAAPDTSRKAGFSCELVQRQLERCEADPSMTTLWQPGEGAARSRLQEFIQAGIGGYQRKRDFPSLSATSLLSTALSAGTLSVAECYSLAREAEGDAGSREGIKCWLGELAWRDFYRQIMSCFPRLAWGEPFRTDTRFIQWRRDTAHFEAWCAGRTGVPLVDAAMRQLLATGWMHNRLRMVVAMFLTKQLFIDWRWGESFFMRHLIDGDFAANNGGWQWSASTGTDAAPYFRVFNPVRQGERFDEQGEFIRAWVPELAHLSGKQIHQPWKYPGCAPDYVAPIVALSGVRERVTEAFRAAQALAREVQHEC